MRHIDVDDVIQALDSLDLDLTIDDTVYDYAKPLQSFIRYIDTLQTEYEQLSDMLSYCDSVRNDILHYMELNACSGVDRMKLTKQLVSISKKRRQVKNRLACVHTILDTLVRPHGVKLHQQIKPVIKSLNDMRGAKYSYRTSVISDTLGGS